MKAVYNHVKTAEVRVAKHENFDDMVDDVRAALRYCLNELGVPVRIDFKKRNRMDRDYYVAASAESD